ncbi:MAG: DUF58 domain-containing protein [Myxococcales bacterium]|nr:DUF58 domain-containing protein [Myxococcales bacterium]MCB9576823.1 DUF58 domain-containing protein [Polyangiaceae bacterium]
MAEDNQLLDPAFVRELEALRRRLEVRARSGAAGEHTARRRGGSAEFSEHRGYVAGDDMRRVDWLAFARTGEPVIKLFRAEEDVIVRLLVDSSASLDFGDPPKSEVARRLAAALGYMALAGSQRAQVLLAQGHDGRPDPVGVTRIATPRRGRGGLAALLRDLTSASPGGSVDLARAVDQTVQRATRPGMLVVLSDFFDAGPVTAALTRAAAAGHDVFLIQIVTRSEVEPDFEGDYALVDAETGATVDVTMDASAVEAYVMRFAGLVEELRAWSKKHGASYLRVTTDEPLEGVVRRFVGRTID